MSPRAVRMSDGTISTKSLTSTKDSISVRNAKMAGFYHHEQKDILEPYFDKFFDVLEQQQSLPELASKTLKQQNSFVQGMLPRISDKEEHLSRLD